MESEIFNNTIKKALEMIFVEKNNKMISINDLCLYWNKITFRILRYLSDKSNIKALELDESLVLDSLKNLVNLDFKEYLDDFCNNNFNICYCDGKNIYINTKAEYDDFIDECLEIDEDTISILNLYERASDNLDLLDTLGLSNIEKELNALLDVESNIEEMFIQDDLTEYKAYALSLFMCHKKLKKYDKHRIDLRERVLTRIINIDYEEEPDDYINPIVFDDNEIYNDNTFIDDYINDVYQSAIFGDSELFFVKAEDYVSDLNFIKHYDDYKNKETDDEDEEIDTSYLEENINAFLNKFKHKRESELYFYLNYIREMENLMEKDILYSDFEYSRSRLLYALNTYDCLLINEKYVRNIYNYLKTIDFKKDDFHEYFVLSTLYLKDIFIKKKYDINTIKELLFIKNYCETCKSDEIKKLIEEYKENENYEMFSSIIFNKKNNIEDTKKLIKSIKYKKDEQ